MYDVTYDDTHDDRHSIKSDHADNQLYERRGQPLQPPSMDRGDGKPLRPALQARYHARESFDLHAMASGSIEAHRCRTRGGMAVAGHAAHVGVAWRVHAAQTGRKRVDDDRTERQHASHR